MKSENFLQTCLVMKFSSFHDNPMLIWILFFSDCNEDVDHNAIILEILIITIFKARWLPKCQCWYLQYTSQLREKCALLSTGQSELVQVTEWD